MMNRLMTAIALLSALALGACGGESGGDLDAELTDAIDQVESEIGEFAAEVEAADQQELQAAWATVESELESAVNSLRSGDAIDPDDIQQELDEFQQEIESADIEADLQQAWEEFRNNFEELMADAT